MKNSKKGYLTKQCPHCGSDNISFQLMQKEDSGSKITGLFVGPILLSDGRKVDEITYALCNDCGNSWVYQNKSAELRKKKERRHLIIGSIIIFSVLLAMLIVSFTYHMPK